ncbi:MAG: iron ABC transporter permease [Caldisphaeraceae archaeon]|nr:iron ABC transporter permease [Caldisphaeraceae archaeon]MEB3691539.1 iron ABC transporter permease [Caldisphaeraceae archaeon]MEB3798522.1 iron ABC transporter permease [Caldisphaeraceae archaeon]
MKKRNIFFIVSIFVSLFIFFIASLSIGAYSKVGFYEAILYLSGHSMKKVYSDIVFYRLIRTMAAFVLGVGLSTSGLTLQYTLKNPLADPFLLGISSGAILGVTLADYFGFVSYYYLYLAAWIGSLLSIGIVLLISAYFKSSASSILIAGISLSYLLSGITTIYMIKLGPKIPGVLFWLFGSVAYSTPGILYKTSIIVFLSLFFLFLMWKPINSLMLGEDMATSLGVGVFRTRFLSILIVSISTSALVAMAGPVGFIGLAAPWMARLIVGSNYGKSLVMSIFTGGLLAIASDILARVVLYPSEAPLTAITSIFGAPFLIYLTLRFKGRI